MCCLFEFEFIFSSIVQDFQAIETKFWNYSVDYIIPQAFFFIMKFINFEVILYWYFSLYIFSSLAE